MAVTGTSVAAAATMLAAAAAIFITFVLCFYLFLCAKRYRGAAPTIGGAGAPSATGVRARFVFSGGAGGCGGAGDGMADQAIAALPRRAVKPGDPAADCAVCIAELVQGEDTRVLPRCGHGFHVDCVDTWLRSHSTCPLCRCAVVDAEKVEEARPAPPEADPESPIFPTNVLFFGSRGGVSTRGQAAASPAPLSPLTREPPRLQQQQPAAAQGPIAGVAAVVEAARVAALRRLLGCRGATPSSPSTTQQPQQQEAQDLESGLGGGESSGSPPAKPPQSGS